MTGLRLLQRVALSDPDTSAAGADCREWSDRHAVAALGIVRTPDEQARLIIDAEGVEWEVYDESGGMGLALDWDYMPQRENPGLIFNSRIDRRRLWPCPPNWRQLSDEELLELAGKARSMT
jgi:hypothetical protein